MPEVFLAIVVVLPAYYLLFHLLNKAEEREQEFYKLKEVFIEKYNKKILDLMVNTPKEKDQEINSIEKETPLELPLDENTRIPIMDGMKVKFDDDEEIVPIEIN